MDEMPPAAPPTWVLLRGLTREAAHWGCFADDFASAWPGSTVITLDLPGNGQCHRQASPATVAGMVAAARAELVRRGVAPPYHLLALSLGAMVATEWARVAPDEVQASVLINTSLRPFSPFYRRLRPRNYAALLRMVLQPATANQREQTVLRLTSQRADEHQAVVPAWAAVRAARPVSTANALRQLMAAATTGRRGRRLRPACCWPVRTMVWCTAIAPAPWHGPGRRRWCCTRGRGTTCRWTTAPG